MKFNENKKIEKRGGGNEIDQLMAERRKELSQIIKEKEKELERTESGLKRMGEKFKLDEIISAYKNEGLWEDDRPSREDLTLYYNMQEDSSRMGKYPEGYQELEERTREYYYAKNRNDNERAQILSDHFEDVDFSDVSWDDVQLANELHDSSYEKAEAGTLSEGPSDPHGDNSDSIFSHLLFELKQRISSEYFKRERENE
ncbi:MAG: hypothetical protein OXB96_00320 [Candidatus Kaiserbacteria bacterium]|nr:hypothetical protein [Candidatus Kaiserbacteria bacterium]